MTRRDPPTIVKILSSKAHIVRKIARNMNVPFAKNDVVGYPDVIQFAFDMEFSDAQEFLAALPIDVFAHRATAQPPN